VTGRVVKRPRALRDLDEAAGHIQRQSSPERAIRFLRAADSTFARLAGMPGLGTRYEPDEPLFAGLRYALIAPYRTYLVFYRPIPGGIEVLRVLHGARDIPGILAGEFGLDAEAGDEDAEAEDV
jgi:toxin ParE1/3/4